MLVGFFVMVTFHCFASVESIRYCRAQRRYLKAKKEGAKQQVNSQDPEEITKHWDKVMEEGGI
jgi:hypothetical protein